MHQTVKACIAGVAAVFLLSATTPTLAATAATSEKASKSSVAQKVKSKKADAKSEKKSVQKASSDKSVKKSAKKAKDATAKKPGKKAAKTPFKGKLNINKASKQELMQLPGIGEVKAEAIIKARKKGKFKSADDLLKVSGVGEKTIKGMSKHLSF